MKTKNIEKHRSEVMLHLMYIREMVDANHRHLERVNGRLNKAENNITKIVTVGSTILSLLTIAVAAIGVLN
jgi:Mg2+ and Co2+ transporter CorA